MKLVCFFRDGAQRVGVLVEGDVVVDLSFLLKDAVKELNMISILSAGESLLERIREFALSLSDKLQDGFLRDKRIAYSLADVKLMAPIPRPGKIICLGLNYSDHAEEAGLKPPDEPVLFSKPATAVVGHDDPVIYPRVSSQVDYEVELAVVIGKKGKDITEEDAYEYVAGYTVFNDVSARDIQFRGIQWFRGKSFDTFAPMGPCLTLKDEIPDPHNLKMQMRINGEVRQKGSTKNMIFKIPYLLSFISAGMTLEPGDVIATGTPSGVGIYSKPQKLLKPGDVMEATIEKIGTLRNKVVSP
ncbi:MAG: fumarylacetoacetate hydrolase family protein [Candidatus Jordarchaeales archaeon]|nr:fumarylacetoacetate hydrolase family protein [Candidatus Jordarchaeia archaeon]